MISLNNQYARIANAEFDLKFTSEPMFRFTQNNASVRLENIVARTGPAGGQPLIRIESADQVVIRNVEIKGATASHAIQLRACRNITIDGVHLYPTDSGASGGLLWIEGMGASNEMNIRDIRASDIASIHDIAMNENLDIVLINDPAKLHLGSSSFLNISPLFDSAIDIGFKIGRAVRAGEVTMINVTQEDAPAFKVAGYGYPFNGMHNVYCNRCHFLGSRVTPYVGKGIRINQTRCSYDPIPGLAPIKLGSSSKPFEGTFECIEPTFDGTEEELIRKQNFSGTLVVRGL